VRVLYTGGTGRVGVAVRQGLAGRYDRVLLYSRRPVEPSFPNESVVVGELTDIDALSRAMEGTDVVVHLAGIPDEGTFDEILEVNIRGTYTVYEAARRASVRRVVFASTNHVVGFFPCDQKVGPGDPPRPDSYYGASKVFGEALARLYYDKWGVESVCLRIGSMRERPEQPRHLATWLSLQDGAELFKCAIEAPDTGFVVAFGVSANTRSFWDNDAAAERLGFMPRDDAEDFAPQIGLGGDGVGLFHGGEFVDPQYSGGSWRLDLG